MSYEQDARRELVSRLRKTYAEHPAMGAEPHGGARRPRGRPRMARRPRRAASGGASGWIAFVKDYRAKHPSLSYAEALKAASPLWRRQSGGRGPAGRMPARRPRASRGGRGRAGVLVGEQNAGEVMRRGMGRGGRGRAGRMPRARRARAGVLVDNFYGNSGLSRGGVLIDHFKD